MIKIYLFTTIIIYNVWLQNIYAQVGINIKTPEGVFHIDGLENNDTAPVGSKYLDDVIITTTGNVGIGAVPVNGAQLHLGASDKALVLNNVALLSPTDVVTIVSPVSGMLVYNITSNTLMKPGLYYWNGTSWARCLSTTSSIQLLNLGVSEPTRFSSLLYSYSNNTGGNLIPFYDKSGTVINSITMSEDGSYAFSFRLYGRGSGFSGTDPALGVYYLRVDITRSGNTFVADAAEMDIVAYSNQPVSYTMTLGCEVKSGDILKFYLGHMDNAKPLTLMNIGSNSAARTSLIYWKL